MPESYKIKLSKTELVDFVGINEVAGLDSKYDELLKKYRHVYLQKIQI